MNENLKRLTIPALWWGWLAVATVACMPLVDVGSLPIAGDIFKKNPINLALFDPLIWIVFIALLAIYAKNDRERGDLHTLIAEGLRLAWPGLALIIFALPSLTNVDFSERKEILRAAKSLFQLVEYLVVTPVVFICLLSSRKWRNRTMWALSLSLLTVIVSIAISTPLGKVFAGEANPYFAGGLLGNRNTFAVFAALSLPLLSGWAFTERANLKTNAEAQWLLLPGIFLPVAALYACLTAWGVLAIIAGVGAVFALNRRGGSLIVLFLLAAVFILDGKEDSALRRKVLARSVQTYITIRDEVSGVESSRPAMRYRRWGANINMTLNNYETGVGLGCYQKKISEYYGDIPKPAANTKDSQHFGSLSHEPFTFSWLMVHICETGMVGLAGMLIFIIELFSRIVGLRGKCENSAGVGGALLGLILIMLWANPVVRGAGPLLGLLLAFSGTLKTDNNTEAKGE